MKIVDYETFIRMPSGTIFAPYEPCIFKDRFQIKVDEGCEYTSRFDGKTKYIFNGTMPLEPWFIDCDCCGAFDCGTYETEMYTYDGDSNDAAEHKMFAVLEPHEVRRLIHALKWALNGCPANWEAWDEHLTKNDEMLDTYLKSLGLKENERGIFV